MCIYIYIYWQRVFSGATHHVDVTNQVCILLKHSSLNVCCQSLLCMHDFCLRVSFPGGSQGRPWVVPGACPGDPGASPGVPGPCPGDPWDPRGPQGRPGHPMDLFHKDDSVI